MHVAVPTCTCRLTITSACIDTCLTFLSFHLPDSLEDLVVHGQQQDEHNEIVSAQYDSIGGHQLGHIVVVFSTWLENESVYFIVVHSGNKL